MSFEQQVNTQNQQPNTQGDQGNPQGQQPVHQPAFNQNYNPNYNPNTQVQPNQFPQGAPQGFQYNVQNQGVPQGNFVPPNSAVNQPEPSPVQNPVHTRTPSDYTGASPLEVSIGIFSENTGVTEAAFADALRGALQYNDPSLIDVQAITQGLKPEQAAQAQALAKAAYTHAVQQRDSIQRTAHSAAGGEQQWNEALATFKASAPKHIQRAAYAMEQAGDIQEAAQFIIENSRSLGLVNSGNGGLVTPSGGAPVGAGLSSQEFKQEWSTLYAQYGERIYDRPEYNQLMQRRALGKQQQR